jgi:diadenosine tetraphosphate (Ap4A) HIT family hydrolase
MYHYRKTRQSYKSLNADDKQRTICTLCSTENGERIVIENDTMYVVPNRISYDVFEGLSVLDHLMIVPKRHVETVKGFTNKEKLDFFNIIGQYEPEGYAVYARGVGNINRSVKHQHTHLIKLKNKRARAYFFLKKPYFVANI